LTRGYQVSGNGRGGGRRQALATMGGLLAFAWTAGADGAVLEVGPGRTYRAPSEAAQVAAAGDTVLIDAGEYRDCAVWRVDRLTLAGRAGEAHLRDVACDGKAIWVIEGYDVTVAHIRFSGAKVPDRNGAGIRVGQDASLTVRDSAFVGNELGLLAGNGARTTVTVERSLFEGNGDSHGLYVNFIARMTVRDSVFRRQHHKHHVKSRALVSEVIDCTIEDGPTGTASYLIDFPNGGTLLVSGNIMHKGPHAENPTTAIAIGLEGIKLPSRSIEIRNNRFASDVPGGTRFVWSVAETPAMLSGNRLTGAVTPLVGPGEVRP
jgi:hypothetical protein